MVKATTLVLDTWEQKVQDGGSSTQLEINNDMSTITSHFISRTTFGNNYKDNKCFNKWKPLFKLLLKLLPQIILFPFSLSFLFMKMQYFTLPHVCMFEWTSNWPTTKYIMVSNTNFKIIILHMVNGSYILFMFIMEETHMFVLHLVKMY